MPDQVRSISAVEPAQFRPLNFGKHPQCVRPPETVAGTMRVFVGIAVLVMLAMDRRPEDGWTFSRQESEDRQRMFEPLRRTERLMRDLAMIADGDTESRHQVKSQEQKESFSTRKRQAEDQSQQMNGSEKSDDRPLQAASKTRPAFCHGTFVRKEYLLHKYSRKPVAPPSPSAGR